MNNPIYKTLVIAPAALIVFYLSMVGGFNLFNTVLAWTNPSATPPTESLTPIPVSDGGTGASSAASARADLGAAASGANSDITSLSPSGNLIISPTGGVGIGTTSLGTGALVTVNGNLVANGELQSTLQTGDGQIRMIAGNYGAMWRNDGTNTWFLLTASGSQYGSWNSLRPMQINDSSGEVYMANGLDVTSGGITFPDGTVQTTAAGGSVANGSQLWTTPGTYTWTVPAGVTRILVDIEGGGGGGGGGGGAYYNNAYYSGNGGGGGGSGSRQLGFIDVSKTDTVTITVASGGIGGSAGAVGGNGSNGGSGGAGGSSYVSVNGAAVISGHGGYGGSDISGGSGASAASGFPFLSYVTGSWGSNGTYSSYQYGGNGGSGANGPAYPLENGLSIAGESTSTTSSGISGGGGGGGSNCGAGGNGGNGTGYGAGGGGGGGGSASNCFGPGGSGGSGASGFVAILW